MGITLEVTQFNSKTNTYDRVAYLPFASKPIFLEEMGVGSGTFDIRSDDNLIKFLKERNVIRASINTKVVSAFVVQTVKPKLLDSGEFSDQYVTVMGKGLKSWFEDAVLHPHNGLTNSNNDERAFNFASPAWTGRPTSGWGNTSTIQKFGDKNGYFGTAPAEWPDIPNAKWVWSSSVLGGNPVAAAPRLPAPDAIVPSGKIPRAGLGTHFFRHDFSTTKHGKYAFFSAADDIYEVYVDGLLMSSASPGSANWSKTSRIDFELPSGKHVIGVKVYTTSGGGFIGALTEWGESKNKKASKVLSVTGSKTWKMYYKDPLKYPDAEYIYNPGWTPGEVLLQLIEEAKKRNVRWAKVVKPTFTATRDSDGEKWTREIDFSFSIGENYSSIISKMEELVGDIWINPATFEINFSKFRGKDLADIAKGSKVVMLKKGKDILTADETIEADIKNALVVEASTGKFYIKDDNSIKKYGVIEDSLNLPTNKPVSVSIAKKILKESSKFSTSATYTITPDYGIVPFEDFSVGDWILAPGDLGAKTRRRVVSIAFTADEATGEPTYSLEFDTVQAARQQQLDRWLSNVTIGSMNGKILTSKIKYPRELTSRSGGSIFLAAPTAQVATSSTKVTSKFLVGGAPTATAAIEWEADEDYEVDEDGVVTYNIYGSPGDSYDGMVILLASTTDSNIEIPNLPVGETYTFAVEAVTQGGTKTLSEPFTLELPIPEEILPTPTQPYAETSANTVTVSWDGYFEDHDATPDQLLYVAAVASETSGGPYEYAGPTIPIGGGSSLFAGLPQGRTLYVALEAVDVLGNKSLASTEFELDVQGVTGEDIEPGSISRDELTEDIPADIEDVSVAAADQSLLVKNHSFETDQYWEVPAAEDTLEPEYPFLRYEVEDATNGTWAFGAVSEYVEGETPETVQAMAKQKFTGLRGATVRFQADAKTFGTAGWSVVQVTITTEIDGVETNIGSAVRADRTGEWVTFDLKAKVPETNNGEISVYLVAIAKAEPTKGTAYALIDNVRLYDNTPVTSVNDNIFSTEEPNKPGLGTNSIWYQQNATYDIIGMWRWNGTSWDPMEVTNEVIGNLDAGKITTGYLGAARIEAHSIEANKLSIGTLGADVAINGDFSEGFYGWGNSSDNPSDVMAVEPGAGVSGSNALLVTPATLPGATSGGTRIFLSRQGRATVAPGDQIKVSFYLKLVSSGGSSPNVTLFWEDSEGNPVGTFVELLPHSTWTEQYKEVSTILTVPAGATTFDINFVSYKVGLTEFMDPYFISSYTVTRLIRGVEIADGAVSATKVSADVVDGKVIKGATLIGGEIELSSLANFQTHYNNPGDNITNWTPVSTGSVQERLSITANPAYYRTPPSAVWVEWGTGGISGSSAVDINFPVPIASSDTLVVEAWVRPIGTSGVPSVGVTVTDTTGKTNFSGMVKASGWSKIQHEVTGVANIKTVRLHMLNSYRYAIDDVRVYSGEVGAETLKIARTSSGTPILSAGNALTNTKTEVTTDKFRAEGPGPYLESLGVELTYNGIRQTSSSWTGTGDFEVATPANVNGRIVLNSPQLLLKNGSINSTRSANLLWEHLGNGYFMNEGQSVTLRDNITNQLTGIILQWSRYTSAGGAANNNWNNVFVPISQVLRASSGGTAMVLTTANGTFITKYIYIGNKELSGHVNNTGVPNSEMVLRAVYGV